MEFKMKSAAGKFETYYIDRKTGTARKVMCRGVCGKDCSNSGKKPKTIHNNWKTPLQTTSIKINIEK